MQERLFVMKKYKNYEVRPIENLKEMLYTSAATWPEKNAFLEKRDGVYEGITFNQYLLDVEGLGTELCARGLLGKRVIVTGENCYAWALAYMTVICGLGVVIPVDKEIPPEEIANIANISEADAVIYSAKYEDKIKKIEKPLDFICFDELAGLCAAGREKINAGDRTYLDLEIDKHEMASLIFTSGTTGVSKGVMLSHHNITFNLTEMCQMIYIGPEDTFLSVLPLHHAYECTCGFLCQIYRGSTIAYCEGLRYIMKNMKEVHPTMILCVPLLIETMYHKIWANIRKNGMEKMVKKALAASNASRKIGIDLRKKLFSEIHETFGGKLRMMIAGGAAVDPDILKGLRDFGILAVQGYGLTECAPLAAVNRDKFYCDSSAGLATPNATLEIVDAAEDGTGDIRFKGENIMLGYYKAPELTAEVIVDGWLYTGDLGFIDKDGFLHITGRRKNVIVTANGKNIFPEELETYLSRNPYVLESVVVGVPDETGRDYDIVAMILPDRERLDEENPDGYSEELVREKLTEAVKQANSMVQQYKRIKKFLVRSEEFPKNTSKKIKRAGLLEEAIAQLENAEEKAGE